MAPTLVRCSPLLEDETGFLSHEVRTRATVGAPLQWAGLCDAESKMTENSVKLGAPEHPGCAVRAPGPTSFPGLPIGPSPSLTLPPPPSASLQFAENAEASIRCQEQWVTMPRGH